MTTRTRTFTLIELLVVISIIAILAAMLLPALAQAKQKAKRLLCLANMKQSHLALYSFGSDNDGEMPYHGGGTWALDEYRHDAAYDMRDDLAKYIGSFEVWRCASLAGLPAIDDASNTESVLRGTFSYLPGTTPSPLAPKQVERRISQQDPDDQVLFDTAYTYNGKWRANHSIGGTFKTGTQLNATYAQRPSFGTHFDGFPEGANTVFADSSGKWSGASELEALNSTSSSIWYAGTR